MSTEFPTYNIQAFQRHEPDVPFFMTPLEKLVREFKGIDKSHSHTFYLLMWIKEGKGTHTIDFRTYEVGPHQLYFLTPGQVHSWELSPDIKGYNLFFEPNYFRSRFPNRLFAYPFYHSHQHRPLLEVADETFVSLYELMYQEYTAAEVNRSEVFLSYLHIILEKANRVYQNQWPGESTHYYDRIRQYEELLEEQFLDIREVKTYAEQLHISPNHLNNICKTLLGKTASQLLYERIIIEAKRLLTHTALSIKEIGYLLHFEDPSYFVRFFRTHTGQTPLDFRESQNR
ncbi:helix-turn-helix domain-containing protein [Siphonobacter curvatus]|uniref:AraC family transcriptional regulator n=1 Tax=Siphonobacter curvatus TaxID=2094562 RepID=A0A2S7ISJ5_9BACT|nr:helix-turn-helix domain-containing protein [Siphonobacter curvatus]PQA60697.1 AraC family transcriptional regulator [Siphonobacter curvatus]